MSMINTSLDIIDQNHNCYSDTSSSGYNDSFPQSQESRMEESIHIVEEGMKIFLNNRFVEAEEHAMKEPDFDDNLYLKTSVAYTSSFFGALSMEKPLLDKANERIAILFDQLSRDRKPFKFSSLFFKTNYNDYTDEQAHAELIYAEANLLSVGISFISDPSILTLIRGSLTCRTVHHTYQFVGEILKNKTNWKSEYMKTALDDGYKFGWGLYNLLLSHLPDRVLKILSIVGYSCSRTRGLEMCRFLTENKRTYRSWNMCHAICVYSFYVEQFFGLGTTDKEWVQKITKERLDLCPEGVFDLMFGARMKQLEGEPREAVKLFQMSIKAQNQMPSLHNVCNWDMLWSYAILCDWHRAAECALFLHENCNWSKSTNLYQWACFQYMIMEEENKPELLPKICEAMKRVPEFKQRFAGRSIPPEKFAITKALAFMDPNSPLYQNLSLPVFELFYIWNVFGNTGENIQLLNPLIERMEKKMKELRETEDKAEGYFVMLLLRGVCLRNLGKHEESIDCFIEILRNERNMKYVTYIPPHAALELGISYLTLGCHQDAKEWLERARDHYTGFLVETLVHLRIHGALQRLKEVKRQTRRGSKVSQLST